MKILYAAGNRYGSYFQLKRFLASIINTNHEVHIAAYSKSLGDLNINYNLDSLLNFTNPENSISFNGNYSFYFNEIKRFNPDLIISDLEVYSSIIGLEMNKLVWQISPILLYTGINQSIKNQTNIYRNNSFIFDKTFKNKTYINYVIKNSNKRFVISHLCDCKNRPSLTAKFEWMRPDFILFDNVDESKEFSGASQKNIDNDMFCGIFDDLTYKSTAGNGKVFISDGTSSFLVDAFYNQKYCLSIIDNSSIEAIICSYMNKFANIGDIVVDELIMNNIPKIDVELDLNVNFLVEEINKL